MILKPDYKELTQGTLFSCAVAEEYPNCSVYGLVITARCDVANDKVNVYNFVPVVRFSDWCRRDGARILASRTSRAVRGEMRSLLQSLGEAPSVLEKVDPRRLLEPLFPRSDQKRRKARAQFENLSERLAISLEVLEHGGGSAVACLWERETREGHKIVRELMSNSLAEYHVLPRVDPYERAEGYVALLREIRHIPRSLAQLVCRGIDRELFDIFCGTAQMTASGLQIMDDDFAFPVGLLRSPEIEFLMQRLTLLFSRIGVEDMSDLQMESLISQVPTSQSGESK